MKVILLTGLSLIAALGLIYIASDGKTTAPQNRVASIHGTAAGSAEAPDLQLALLDGRTIRLSDFRGKKPVVLDFWASWCPNCQRDMPRLNQWYGTYKDQVEVIGINLQESRGTAQNFIQSRGINFPIALDPHGAAARMFGIQYTNTHFLIDKSGNLVRTIPGDISEADIQSLLR